MAFRIPLQNGSSYHRPSGLTKLKQMVPSFSPNMRSAAESGPYTVEMAVVSFVLMTLGGICLIWTAIKPEYGSFLLGGGLVTCGACWLGVVCALTAVRWKREEKRAKDAATASTAHGENWHTSGDGGDTDDEEMTMIVNVEPDSSRGSASTSAVSIGSQVPLQTGGSDVRPPQSSQNHALVSLDDHLPPRLPTAYTSTHPISLDDRQSTTHSQITDSGVDLRSVISDFRSSGVVSGSDSFQPSSDILHQTALPRPDVVGVLPGGIQVIQETGGVVRQNPEGAISNKTWENLHN